MARQRGRICLRWKLAICIASAALCISSNLRADDAQDAVDLLALALKCPIKPLRGWSDTSDWFEHVTNEFKGTKSTFRVHISTEGDNTMNYSEESRFADLASTKIEPGYSRDPPHPVFEPPKLTLFCRGQQPCLKATYSSAFSKQFQFYVCDGKAAQNAKLAIDTLIKLNR
jgi:hypothetical protein